MTKTEQKKAVQFTRMCKFWRTNECKMGADCTFAHSTSELRPSPKPCFDFVKNGFCARGQACRFVHELGKSKTKLAQMQSLQMFQPWPDSSQLLATYGMPLQSPMSIEEPSQYVSHYAPPLKSSPWVTRESPAHVSPLVQAPPGLHQIPVPTSLIGGSEKRTDDKDDGASCSSRLSEASLGMEPFPISVTKSMVPDDMTTATRSMTSTMCLSATPSHFSQFDGQENCVWLSV
ncbi:unnamed protein product [Symbiodinium sp. CCMP2456]|nr:unnamed protein product [Symbiodinium sp. CCMP2456]